MSDAMTPKQALTRWGLRPKRHFGQNFLQDSRLAARIAELATTPAGGTCVEIGAGLGALTRPLLARAARVVAIERDRELVPILTATFEAELASGQLELLEADAKTADYAALLASGPGPHVIAGNLPYQITGPLLQQVVGYGEIVSRAVLLVQLEVAERLVAAPGGSSYGALSVFVQARYEPHRALVIRRGAFYPQPGVDSAVVVLEPRTPPLAEESEAFRALVHAAFGQRRKKLRNAWSGVPLPAGATLVELAARAGVDLDARGETLSVTDFARMALELGA